jgi:GrpB-like predicted nucleotidyltransferase (UPF0157 family)
MRLNPSGTGSSATAVCSHPEDLELYATTKRRLARDTAQQPGDYSLAKNDVIDAIYARIFSQPAE